MNKDRDKPTWRHPPWRRKPFCPCAGQLRRSRAGQRSAWTRRLRQAPGRCCAAAPLPPSTSAGTAGTASWPPGAERLDAGAGRRPADGGADRNPWDRGARRRRGERFRAGAGRPHPKAAPGARRDRPGAVDRRRTGLLRGRLSPCARSRPSGRPRCRRSSLLRGGEARRRALGGRGGRPARGAVAGAGRGARQFRPARSDGDPPAAPAGADRPAAPSSCCARPRWPNRPPRRRGCSVSAAPAALRTTLAGPLPGTLGHAAFAVTIGKGRGAFPGPFFLEWNPNELSFCERRPQDAGAVVPASARRADPAPAAGAVVAFAPAGRGPDGAGRQPPRHQHPAHRRPRRAG